MANAVEPAGSVRRPGVVTVACWLLYLAAVCQVLTAVITLSQLGATRQAYKKIFAGTSMEGAEATLVAITAATTVGVGLIFAIGYIVLAILDGRGKNPARIVTWVVAGLSICCSGSGLVSNAVGFSSFGGNARNGAPTSQQIQQALKDALPGWYQPLLTTVGIVSIAALVTAVILLALPLANDFFRKPKQPVWEPPVPPPTA
jgi:Ni/Fe-hydrogenase subunit HybB-like protein